MATVKEAMDRAARQCSITPPSDWITPVQTTYLEMKDFLAETVGELLDRVDWPAPISAVSQITGPGTAVSNYSQHDLPAAYKRLQRNEWAVWEESNTRRTCTPIQNDGQWQYLDQVGSAGAYRYYRVKGDEDAGFQIEFFRALSSSQTVNVNYVSKNWLRLNSDSSLASTWTDVADTLLLPRELIELGVIWRFRRRKGIGYADMLAEYETKLTRKANDYRTSRSINFGGLQHEHAHPMRVPVPDYIPSS